MQVMVDAAYHAILIKIWGGTSPTLNPIASWILIAWSKSNIAMPIIVWFTFFFYFSRTKSGLLHLRKIELDQDVETRAGSNSIPWTSRTLFVMGIYFFFGCHMGLDIFFLFTGQAIPSIPWTHLLKTVGVNFVLSWLSIKCFDWAEHNSKGGAEHKEEEEATMLLYVPMIDPVIL